MMHNLMHNITSFTKLCKQIPALFLSIQSYTATLLYFGTVRDSVRSPVKNGFCNENQHDSVLKERASSTRCFDSPLEGSHSTTLNAMTHDFASDALDRCTLGDLCLRHLPGPQEQISTVFFLSALKANRRQQFSLFWGPGRMEPAKMQTLLTVSIFPQPNACSQKSLIGYFIDLLSLYGAG